jgi:hypothetical protein
MKSNPHTQRSKNMATKKQSQTQKPSPPSYRFNKKGKIVGPDGKDVSDFLGDTPIVISGGSLSILSDAELDDEDNPGHDTKQLRAKDAAKHVTSILLVGLRQDATNPNRFAPSNPANPACTIIIHYG